NVVANTSGTASNILLDTTRGNNTSSISHGTITVASGSTSGVNLSVLSSGAPISVGAISVPGTITLDNTYAGSSASNVSGSLALANATTSTGIAISGTLTAGNLSNATNGIYISGMSSNAGATADYSGVSIGGTLATNAGAIYIKGAAQGANYGINDPSSAISSAGSVTLLGNSATGVAVLVGADIGAAAGITVTANDSSTPTITPTGLSSPAISSLNSLTNSAGVMPWGAYVTTNSASPTLIDSVSSSVVGIPTPVLGFIAGSGIVGVNATTTILPTPGFTQTATSASYLFTYHSSDNYQKMEQINFTRVGNNIYAYQAAAKYYSTVPTLSSAQVASIWATATATNAGSTGYGLQRVSIASAVGDITITGLGAAAGANTGIYQAGQVVQGTIGGNIYFISNNSINQTGPVSVVANTSSVVGDVMYVTRQGNKTSSIINGPLTVNDGSTQAVNYELYTAGAPITVGGAVNVPGVITLDNTFASGSVTSGSLAPANATTSAGITINNALTAGNISNATNGVLLNGYSNTNFAITATGTPGASILASKGNISINGTNAGTLQPNTSTINFKNTAGTSSITATTGQVNITGTTTSTTPMSGYGLVNLVNVAVTANAGIGITANGTSQGTDIWMSGTTSLTNNTAGDITLTGTNTTVGTGAIGGPSTNSINQNANGGNISIISNGNISQSGAINVVANTSGTASNILLDTTRGNNTSSISHGTITVASGSTSGVNLKEVTAGAPITTGAVSMPGSITLDNTYGGTAGPGSTPVSGFISIANNNIGSLATTNAYGINVGGALSAGTSVNILGVSNTAASTAGGAVQIGANISSSQLLSSNGITIGGQSLAQNGIYVPSTITLQSGTSSIAGGNVNLLAYDASTNSALYAGANNLAISTYGGDVNLGTSANPIYGGAGINSVLGNITSRKVSSAGGNVNIYATATAGYNAINDASAITADGSITIVGNNTTAAPSAPVVSLTGAITLTSATNNSALRITGNTVNSSDYTGASTGISATGAININSNGGSASFVSNNSISQTGAVTVAANTSGTTSNITYDTTNGNKNSIITPGALTLTGGMAGSSSRIDYTMKSSGASIYASGAITVPGSITLDNTYLSGVDNGITVSNSNTYSTSSAYGVRINGTLTAGAAIAVQGVNSGGVNWNGNAAIQTNNNISILSSQKFAGNGITFNGLTTASNGQPLNSGNTTTFQSGTSSIVGGDINFFQYNTGGNSAIYGGLMPITAYGANVNIGTSSNPIYGGAGINCCLGDIVATKVSGVGGNVSMYGTASTSNNKAVGHASSITADGNITIVGNNTNAAPSTEIVNLSGLITLTNATKNSTLSITANSATTTGYTGASTGISVSGNIVDNSNGGNISFISNNSINQTGTTTLDANTSGTVANITYNTTTTGNKSSTITTGPLTLTGGVGASTTGINYSVLTSGANITVNNAISMPGIITLNNSYLNGVNLGINASNLATYATTNQGISVAGALTAANVNNVTNAINIVGVSNGNGAAYLSGNMTATKGDINIQALSTGTNWYSLYTSGTAAFVANAGNINISGSSTSTSASGLDRILLNNTGGIVASGNITIAGNDASTIAIGQRGLNIQGGVDILAGGNLTLGGTGASSGVYAQNGGLLVAKTGNLTIQGASVDANGWAYVDVTKPSANTVATNGTALYLNVGTTSKTVSTGPVTGTFMGAQAGGSVNLWGSALQGTGIGTVGNITGGTVTLNGKTTGYSASSNNPGVWVQSGDVFSTIGAINIYGSQYGNTTGVNDAVFLTPTSMISAKTDINIAGYSSSTNMKGVNTYNALLAGGNINIGGQGGAGGVWVSSSPVYAGGNLNVQNAALDSNNYAILASGAATATGSGGHGAVLTSGTTATTISTGPNISTYTGFTVAGTATVSGTNTNTAGSGGYGVWFGNGGGNYKAGTWNITASNVGTTTLSAFIMNTGILTSTTAGITINASTTSSGAEPGVIYFSSSTMVPIVSAGGVTMTAISTGTNQSNILNLNNTTITNTTGDIVITGTNPAAGGLTGIYSTGTITQNGNGSNIRFFSNNQINQGGNITIAANTSGADSQILYDTSRGNKLSTINGGAVTFTGSSTNLINYINIASGAPLIVNSSLNVPGYISFDNTYLTTSASPSTPVSGGITAANAWQYGTVAASGVAVSGTIALQAKAGIYVRGVVGASSSSAQPAYDAVTITAATFTTSGTFTAGQDAINVVGIEPSQNTTKNAIAISGTVSFTNNSTKGNTNFVAYSGNYNDAVSVTNNAGSGSIDVSAIGATAAVVIASGGVTTFTQNANDGVFISSSSAGNVNIPRIINNGTGPVVVAAGSYLPVGTGTGGQIVGQTGNYITSATGNVYLYSGQPGTTANSTTTAATLACLTSSTCASTSPLYTQSFSNSVFSQAYAAGNVAATNLPIATLAVINTANVNSGTGYSSFTTTATNGPVIQYRISPTFNLLLTGQITKVYGTNDPNASSGNLAVPGTLDYQLNALFKRDAVANTSYTVVNGVDYAQVNVNGVIFKMPLNEFLNSIQGTRAQYGTIQGEQVNGASSTSFSSSYGYTFSSTHGVLVSSGVSVTIGNSTTNSATGLVITPAALTITAADSSKQYGSVIGNGTTLAGSTGFVAVPLVTTADGVSLNDAIASVTVTAGSTNTMTGGTNASGSPSGFAASANAGTYSLTASAPVFSTGSASNYTISYAPGVLTVSPRNLSVTVTSQTKTYGSTTATAVVGTDTTTYNSGSPANTQGSAAGGYAITSGNAASGDTIQAMLLTSTGGPANAAIGTYPITIGGVMVNGVVSPNYVITPTPGTLTVTRAPLTITANAQNGATYGAAYSLGTSAFSTSGLVAGDSVSSITLQYNNAVSVPATTGAGTYASAITPSAAVGTGLNNYTIVYANGNLTVNSAVLTATPIANSATYNANALGLTGASSTAIIGSYSSNNANYSITGYKNSDTISTVTPTITGSMGFTSGGSSVAAPTNAGSYAYTAGTFSGSVTNTNSAAAGYTPAPNYTIAFAAGSNVYTINKATANIAATKVYDGTVNFNSTSQYTISGIGGQTLGLSAIAATSDSANVVGVSTLNIASGTITSGTGTASNYQLPSSSNSVSITPAPLTATIVGNPTKTYDATNAAILTSANYSISGFVTANGVAQGATVNQVNGTYNSVNATANTAGGAGTYATTVTSLLSSSNFVANNVSTIFSNYSLPSSAQGAGVITKAALTITAADASKYVGTTDSNAMTAGSTTAGSAFTYTYSGLQGIDTLSSAATGISVTPNRSTPVQKTVAGATSSATLGADGSESYGVYANVLVPTATAVGNYTINPVSGSYNILAAGQLLVTVGKSSVVYGGYNSATNLSQAATVTASYCVIGSPSCTGAAIQNLTMTAPVSGSTWTAVDSLNPIGTIAFTVAPTTALISANYSNAGFLNVGTYGLTPSNVTPVGTTQNFINNAQYPIIYTAGNIQVTPKTLTVTNNSTPTKVYDATTNLTGISLVGDQLSASSRTDLVALSGSGSYNSKVVSNTAGYTINGIVLSGADAANYVLGTSSIPGTNGVITQAPITIGGLTAQNKVYDTTQAAVVIGTPSSTGVLGSDAVSVSLNNSPGATFAQSAVGSNIAVSVPTGGFTLSGNDSGNYYITGLTVPLSANITKAPLTISGLAAQNKVYNGSTNYADIITGNANLSGVLTADQNSPTVLALSGSVTSGTFASANVANNIGVSADLSGLQLSGTSAQNYQIVGINTPLVANITAAPVYITGGLAAQNKIYDTTTAAKVNVVGAQTLSGVITGDAVAVSNPTSGNYANSFTFTSPNVANSISVNPVLSSNAIAGISLTGAQATNYYIAGIAVPQSLAANITPAPVYITGGLTAQNKVYDTTTAATVAAGVITLSGKLGIDNLTVASPGTSGFTSSFNFSQSNIGSALTVSPIIGGSGAISGISLASTTNSAGNYYIAGIAAPQSLAANITPAPLTISGGLTAQNKVYDTNTAANITATGVQTLSGLVGSDINTNNVTIVTSGPYAGTFSAANVGNSLTVTPTTASTTINGSSYNTMTGVTLSGPSAGNYYVSGVSQTLAANITPAPVYITGGLTAQNKVYDTTTAAVVNVTGTQTLSGVFTADANKVAVTSSGSYNGNFSSANVGNSLTVTPVTTSVGGNFAMTGPVLGAGNNGNASANYYVAGVAPNLLAANITPAPLYINGGLTAQSKVYDATSAAVINSTGNQTLSGVFTSDTGNVLVSSTGPYAGANFTANNVNTSNVGTAITVTPATSTVAIGGQNYTVMSGVSISGSASGNYYVAGVTPNSLTANITKANLTITARNQASFYTLTPNDASSNSVITYMVSGLLGNDTVTSATTTATVAPTNITPSSPLLTTSSNVGSYAANVSNAQGTGLANYSITYVPGTYTIVPAGQLLISTTGVTYTYGSPQSVPTPIATYMDANHQVISTLVTYTPNNPTAPYNYHDNAGAIVSFNIVPVNASNSGVGVINVGVYGLATSNLSITNASNLTSAQAVVTGNLQVTPLAVAISATPTTVMYNGATQSQSAYTTSPAILTGDAVTVSGGVATGKNVGTYSSNLSTSGSDAGNYKFTYNNANLVITPYIIDPSSSSGPNIAATANNKVYDT
ncbi:YDG domain-containing protein, partial [Polynucleobacter sp. MWH-Berg-3C6]|uniref:YDG domain-containing protein n=2 Tax=Polynucleobacter sp. MWH-Berg-3C6 TaxID=1855882 RepID=UPI001C0AE20D